MSDKNDDLRERLKTDLTKRAEERIRLLYEEAAKSMPKPKKDYES